MSGEQKESASLGLSVRTQVVIGAVVVAVIAAVALFAWIDNQREEDARTDGYYCVRSDVSPDDRAPASGRLCSEVLSG